MLSGVHRSGCAVPAAGMPGMPPVFQFPIMNPAWMEMYHNCMAGYNSIMSTSPPHALKRKGFSIADILSEEEKKPTTPQEVEMKRIASHPYYPAVPSNIPQHPLQHQLAVRASGGAMRQCRNKRVRTIFTPEQLEQLEKIFEKQQYMVGTERYYLASKLNLSEAQVKVWFQNRRIKWRKQSGLDVMHSRVADIDDYATHPAEFSDTCSESGFSDSGSL